jgi:hypothetical protein
LTINNRIKKEREKNDKKTRSEGAAEGNQCIRKEGMAVSTLIKKTRFEEKKI